MRKVSASAILIAGAILSLIVLFAGVVPIYWIGSDQSGFLQNLGNLGQFISGLFAPLAFIGLIVAVLLQSKELELQREELRQSRKALELQATELQNAVEQYKHQNTILLLDVEEQRRLNRKKEIEDILDTTMGKLVYALEEFDKLGEVEIRPGIRVPTRLPSMERLHYLPREGEYFVINSAVKSSFLSHAISADSTFIGTIKNSLGIACPAFFARAESFLKEYSMLVSEVNKEPKIVASQNYLSSIELEDVEAIFSVPKTSG